jgi:hypothetical protein
MSGNGHTSTPMAAIVAILTMAAATAIARVVSRR